MSSGLEYYVVGQVWGRLGQVQLSYKMLFFNGESCKFSATPRQRRFKNPHDLNNFSSQRSLDCTDQIWGWSG